MKSTLLPVLVIAMVVSACAAPSSPRPGGSRLIVSDGVREIFDDPEVMEVAATDRVRCRQTYRVGSHLPIRTCMTVTEWKEKARKSREEAAKNLAGPCRPVQSSSGGFMNPNVTGALLQSTCGESINRGGGG